MNMNSITHYAFCNNLSSHEACILYHFPRKQNDAPKSNNKFKQLGLLARIFLMINLAINCNYFADLSTGNSMDHQAI